MNMSAAWRRPCCRRSRRLFTERAFSDFFLTCRAVRVQKAARVARAEASMLTMMDAFTYEDFLRASQALCCPRGRRVLLCVLLHGCVYALMYSCMYVCMSG
jgi:hypothetical protein